MGICKQAGVDSSADSSANSDAGSGNNSAVASNERRGAVTMGLLWLTMVASFPTVLVGFEWYKQGLSFTQMLTCLSLTIGILLLYSVPVCVIAVRSGLSLKDLMAKLFGPVVTRSLTSLLVVVYLGWYAITALLMADGFTGILGGKQFLPALALVFSILMAFNNFFGFKGVANFAKFVGAPAIICWILYVLFKSAPDVPMYIRQSHDVLPFTTAFCTVSQFLLGFAIWGNEADFWRNGKSKPLTVGLAVFCALFIGEFIFPLTGWLLAAKTGITESGAATAYMNNFAFGKAGLVALLFLASQYFAVNDSNLYAFANGVEAFTKASHRMVVVCLSLLAGVVALVLGLTGTQHALASVCSLSAVLLPTASILISVEWYGFRRNNHQSDLPPASKSVLFAWSVSTVLGILTSDIIPGTHSLMVGIPAVQAWLAGIAVYIPLRKMELTVYRESVPVPLSATCKMPSFKPSSNCSN